MMQAALVGFYLAVTLGALDLLHVDMLRMEQGLVDPLRFALGVTLVAVLLAYDHLPVALRYRGGTMQYETDEQLVLLRDGEMMTVMAIELFVLALRPRVVCRLHQVAPTRTSVVLGKIVGFMGNKAAAEHDSQNERRNGALLSEIGSFNLSVSCDTFPLNQSIN
jgi:hypothetical protein